MSNFRTQAMANNFPLWSRVRKDPSSLGQRTLSLLGEYFDAVRSNNVQLSMEQNLLKHGLGVGHLWVAQLADEQAVEYTGSPGGGFQATEPTPVPSSGSVERVDYLEDLLFGPTTRLAEVPGTFIYNSDPVWSSTAPHVYAVLARPCRLHIVVEGSTQFERRIENPAFQGWWGIQIQGKDLNDIEIRESIDIHNDGYYVTRNIFSSIEQIDYSGFNGEITVSQTPVDIPYVWDPFRACITQEVEGPLKISFFSGEGDYSGETYLRYFTDDSKHGANFLHGGYTAADNEVDFADQVLKDSDGSAYTAVSMAINPNNTKLYVLDSAGVIHIHDHGMSPFVPVASNDQPTIDLDIIIQPVSHYARFGRVEPLFTRHDRLRTQVLEVSIKRISPAGTVRWLQADLTWGLAEYLFQGLPSQTPEKSWADFRFETEYNETGQWDYVIYVSTLTDEKQVGCVSVLADSLWAETDLNTGIVNLETLHFDHYDNIVLANSNTLFLRSEHADYYILDLETETFYFRENYNSILVDAESYELSKLLIPNGLDKVGLDFSLPRLLNESLGDYRKRLLLESRDPSSSSQADYIRTLNRKVGLFDKKVLIIDLVLDAGVPLAIDPYIEITSTKLRAYNNHAAEELDFEINFLDKTNGWFLTDVFTAFDNSSYFSVTVGSEYNHWIRSETLKYDNSDRLVPSELLTNSHSHKLRHRHIKRIEANLPDVFLNEKNSASLVSEDGDFFVDKLNGVLFTHTLMRDRVSYVYGDFPFKIYSQAARAVPYNDDDLAYKLKDLEVDSLGVETPSVLNSIGASIANRVLLAHSLTWGK